MNIIRLFVALAICLALAGCTKDQVPEVGCVSSQLEALNMVRYQGQYIGCKLFVALYIHQHKQYFLLNSHCADMISYPTDCQGNQLCTNGEDAACRSFYDDAVWVGIVGVER